MWNRILNRSRDAYHPNVFGPPEALTATLFYRASLRLPQPNLPGASGHATPMSIRTSTASAGQLMLTTDQNGMPKYTVIFPNLPVDR